MSRKFGIGVALIGLVLGLTGRAYVEKSRAMSNTNSIAKARTVKGGATNLLVMDFFLKTADPCTVNAITFRNTGTATARDTGDIQVVKFWYESGADTGFNSATDNLVGTASYYDTLGGLNWYLTGISAPRIPGGSDSVRVYVTVDLKAVPQNGRTIIMQIPQLQDTSAGGTTGSFDLMEVGIFVSNPEDGPSADITNTMTQTIDVQKPRYVVSGSSYRAGTKILTAVFDEGVDSTYVDPSKFTYWTRLGSVKLTGATVTSGDNSTVTMKVTKAVDAAIHTFASGATDSLNIDSCAVRDTAWPAPGNAIADTDSVDITFLSDSVAPTISLVKYNAGTKILAITFDEYVRGSSIKPLLQAGGDSLQIISGTIRQKLSIADTLNITPTDSLDEVTIKLSAYEDTLIQALSSPTDKDSLGFKYSTGTDTTIKDISGNNLAAGVFSILNIADQTAPVVDSIKYNAETNVLTLYCNEVVRTTDFITDSLIIHRAGVTSDSVRLGGVTAPTGNDPVRTLNLTNRQKAHIQNMYLAAGAPKLDILKGAFKDYANNLVTAASNLSITYIEDGTPPAVGAVTYYGGNKKLKIGFDEPVDADPASNVNLSLVRLRNYTTPDTVFLTGATITPADSDTLVIRLTNRQASEIDGWAVTDNDSLWLLGGINNLAGLPVEGRRYNLDHIADDSVPKLIAQKYDGNTKRLSLIFNEYVKYSSVDSVLRHSRIKIWGTLAKTLAVDTVNLAGSTLLDTSYTHRDTYNRDTMEIKLTPAKHDSVVNKLTGTRHVIITYAAADSLCDITGKALASLDSSLVFVDDITGPKFVSAAYNAGTKKFTIRFDEYIDHTPNYNLDVSKLRVHTKGQTDYTYFTDAIDTIIQTDVDTAYFYLTPAQDKGVQTIALADPSPTDTMLRLDILTNVARDVNGYFTEVDSLNATITYTADATGPTVDTSVVKPSITADRVLKVTFNEWIAVDSTDVSKWWVTDYDHTDSVQLTGSKIDTTKDSTVVVDTLTTEQYDRIAGFGTIPLLRLNAGAVRDLANNPNAAISGITTTLGPDTIKPYMLSTGWYRHSDSLLVLKFNEVIHSVPWTNVVASKVHLSDTRTKASITLAQAEHQSPSNTDSVVFRLTGAHRDTISTWRAAGATKLFVRADSAAFQDMASNYNLAELDSLANWYPDTINPTLISVAWTRADTFYTGFEVGDTIRFVFSEHMDKSTITSTNVDTRLKINRTGGSYGYSPTCWWNAAGDTFTLLLGSGFNLQSPDTVNPSDDVKDLGGEKDSTLTFTNCLIRDNLGPKLRSITFVNSDGPTDTRLTQGDKFIFNFSEPLDSTCIDSSNASTRLGVTNSHIFGCDTVGGFVWSRPDFRSCTVTVAKATFTVVSNMVTGGDSVNPTNSVVDRHKPSGNADESTLRPLLETVSPIFRSIETYRSSVTDTMDNKIRVAFSEGFGFGATGVAANAYWRVAGSQPDSVVGAIGDTTKILYVPRFGTGYTPLVEYVATTGYADSSKNYLGTYSATAVDKIPPRFVCSTAVRTDLTPPESIVVVTFTEPIQGSNTPGTWRTEAVAPRSMTGIDSTTRRVLWGCKLATDSTCVQYLGSPGGGNLRDYATPPCFVAAATVYAKAGTPATGAPTSLDAAEVSSSQINLTWVDNSANEEGFQIWRKDSATGSYVKIDSVGANVQFYANRGLLPEHWYWYKVRAYNIYGVTGFSNVDSAKTQPGTKPFYASVKTGWNMHSVPGTAQPSMELDSIFKGNTEVYTYVAGAYTTPTDAEIGVGYWVAQAADRVDTITVTPCTLYTKVLRKGWNMIGTTSDIVPLSQVVVNPDTGLVPNTLYWYNPVTRTYELKDALVPPLGYWIAARCSCTITVRKTGKVLPVIGAAEKPEILWGVDLRLESAGVEKILRFGAARTATTGFDTYIDKIVPPSPPGAHFAEIGTKPVLNAYFHSEIPGCVTDIRKPGNNEWKLAVNVPEYTISWNPSAIPENLTLTLLVGNESVDMREQAKVSVKGASSVRILANETGISTIPTVFALSQNTPNPFVSGTEIKLAIPTRLHTTVTIYNLGGQLVRTLVDKEMEPGYYTLYWDGTDNFGTKLSGGVYFYKLQTDGFSSIKKLTILR
ncbi:MAG: FlgD immunoglobulin-like domain containing protein [bacterium]|nr:FlgD immunoglobulin-like domain containing protein [bacterium]